MGLVTKKSIGDRIFDVANTVLLFALVVVTLYPFLYVAFSSVSRPSLLAAHRGLLLVPQGFSLTAYRLVFQNPMILVGYQNTLIYVFVGTALQVFLTALAAYGLSRRYIRFGNALMFFITFTMFFSGGLIPTYLLVRNLGMLNTRWALVIPGAIHAWNLIIMRTFFANIPDSLEESAKLDGANDFTIFFRIVIPLSMAVIAVMVLFYGVGHWNGWFRAMIYLKKRELFPIQLVLREILILNSTEYMMQNVEFADREPVGDTIKFATIMVATVPILFAYPFLQKYFVKGVMIGAIKQ